MNAPDNAPCPDAVARVMPLWNELSVVLRQYRVPDVLLVLSVLLLDSLDQGADDSFAAMVPSESLQDELRELAGGLCASMEKYGAPPLKERVV